MNIQEKTRDLMQIVESAEKPLDGKIKSVFEVVAKNQAKELETLIESNTGDVAPYLPLLLPLVRRTLPNLVANDLVGIQPINMPTGYIYTMRYRYAGFGKDASDKTGGRISPLANGQIIRVEATKMPVKGDVVKVGDKTANVIYVEDDLVLVDAQIAVVGETLKKEDNSEIGTIVEKFSNELGFRKVLKNYSGAMPTSEAELKGYDMAEIGLSVDNTPVSVQSRKLKATYTIEMLQDLKAMYGENAELELLKILEAEVKTEIDLDVISKVKSWAGVSSDFDMGGTKQAGRYLFETASHLALKIAVEARKLASLNKRGEANVLMASPKVIGVLSALPDFKFVASKADIQGATGVVGTFNGMKVVQDTFATKDYVSLFYKGSERDAIGFFAPYVPVSFTRVIDPASGQPGVILNTRYALIENPNNTYGSDTPIFGTTFAVDFSNTILA